jgi:hypothetical protein
VRGANRKSLSDLKKKILWEYSEAVGPNQHLLNLALNEAEALAWQTQFPHLVFPTLAEEKATNVVRWFARQRVISQAALLLGSGNVGDEPSNSGFQPAPSSLN